MALVDYRATVVDSAANWESLPLLLHQCEKVFLILGRGTAWYRSAFSPSS